MTKIANPAVDRVKLGGFLCDALGRAIDTPSTLMEKEGESSMDEGRMSVEGAWV
jgi:hypothetical protein